MITIEKVDLAKPLQNFATKQGKQLFEWAEQTWRGFLEQILQLMEGEDISDHDFTMMCDQLARVHSAQYPHKHAEMLKDWAALVEFPLVDIKAWEASKNLPAVAKREEIVRQMLKPLIKHVRTLDAQAFLATMVHLVNLQDLRKSGTFVSVSPNTYRRSIHRLGLPETVSTALFVNSIRTLSDLKSFIEPPRSGGLITHSRLHANPNPRPPFNPKEKLQRLEGIDADAAEQILETAKEWHNMWPRSQLFV